MPVSSCRVISYHIIVIFVLPQMKCEKKNQSVQKFRKVLGNANPSAVNSRTPFGESVRI